MNLSLAFVKNHSKVLYHQFGSENQENPEKERAIILDFEELENRDLHGIFLPQDLLQLGDEETTAELREKLAKTSQYAPIKTVDTEKMSDQIFDRLNKEEAINETSAVYTSWTLKNNLALVENMFANLSHLKGLFPNDRTTFFEELWHLLRSNLGATQLTLAYNHLKKAEKENEKNELIRVVVEGTTRPNPTENKELGEALFKNYEGKFAQPFEVYSWDETSGQLVILASVKESPVIIMATLFNLSPLQRATLNCLFEGLQ